jgi:hypothetical protein
MQASHQHDHQRSRSNGVLNKGGMGILNRGLDLCNHGSGLLQSVLMRLAALVAYLFSFSAAPVKNFLRTFANKLEHAHQPEGDTGLNPL